MSSSTLTLIGDTFQARIGFWKYWFLRRGENRSTRGKTSQSREENQQQTQLTYDAGSGNRTRDTLVGDENSHHCTIPAPLKKTLVLLEDKERGANVGNIWSQAQWPIMQGKYLLISPEWHGYEYFYSSLDGIVVHCRVSPSLQFTNPY